MQPLMVLENKKNDESPSLVLLCRQKGEWSPAKCGSIQHRNGRKDPPLPDDFALMSPVRYLDQLLGSPWFRKDKELIL